MSNVRPLPERGSATLPAFRQDLCPAAQALAGRVAAWPVPERVAVIGLGPSAQAFLNLVKRGGGRRAHYDEVWGINAIGDIIACDRVFHMDDVRIQEIRVAARPKSNIAVMLRWLKEHPGPVYTSRPHPDYPGLIPYPLVEVAATTGYAYFNSTAAYPIALAIHLGVRELAVYGNDFTYANAHDAEKGRACVEFWLGYAAAAGLKLSVPGTTSLMDACVPADEKPYGYDTLRVDFTRDAGGELRGSFTEREGPLPSAEEIEHRYDHSRHPSPLVEQALAASAPEPAPVSELMNGERQVAPTVDGIRRDHVARYEWAAALLGRLIAPPPGRPRPVVLDAACGVGYGTAILSSAGFLGVGYDRSEEAVAYARTHYAEAGATFTIADLNESEAIGDAEAEAIVCFETIEHLADPAPLLRRLAVIAPLLLASVPNEDVLPHGGNTLHHFRHYTKDQFAALLQSAGWRVVQWWGQAGPESEVERDVPGRTLIAVAERA